MISNEYQTIIVFVQQGKSEYPVQFVQKSGPVFFVKVNEHFRVGCRVEHVALGFQLFPDFLVVVYFSVENDTDTLIFVEYGLVAAGGYVNDRQASVSEGEILISVYGLIIRSPMFDRGQHFRHE